MQIPKRLQTIGNLIPEGANIGDIGADHGLLEQFIAVTKKDFHILAIENKKGPLIALRNSVETLQNIEVSHSDGLNQVGKEIDTLVLAGMGGDNIISILSKNHAKLKSIKQIVVDAHSFIPKVREYLTSNGFSIEKEVIVYEKDIFYIIISFVKTNKKVSYSKDEIEFGYNLFLDPLYTKYKKYEISKLNNIVKILKSQKSQSEKLKEIKSTIRRFKAYGQN